MNRYNIIVTAGPTNEKIDAVMKITNMSTGALGSIITDTLIVEHEDEIGTIYYVSTKLTLKPSCRSKKIQFVQIESAQDLLNALEKILTTTRVDFVIHSCAVGDYIAKYAIRAENIVDQILSLPKEDITKENLMQIFKEPNLICNADTKISSYEDNLLIKLSLTPKVISFIKSFAPNVKLIGFKLLEGVSENELYEVAHKLLVKNSADYIVANLLDKIKDGKHFAIILNSDQIISRCETKKEIATTISSLLFK